MSPRDKEETIAPPTPVTILIIDDEPGIVSALAGLLERHGYIVSTAGNGALAWEHLHTQRDDVILCDLPPSPQPSRTGCRYQALRRTASGPTLARASAGRRQGGDAERPL